MLWPQHFFWKPRACLVLVWTQVQRRGQHLWGKKNCYWASQMTLATLRGLNFYGSLVSLETHAFFLEKQISARSLSSTPTPFSLQPWETRGEKRGNMWKVLAPSMGKGEVFPWCLFLTSSDFWARAEETNYVMSQPKFKPQEAGDEDMKLPYSWFFISSWMVSFKKGLNHGSFHSWYSYSSTPPWAPPLPSLVRLVAGQPGS